VPKYHVRVSRVALVTVEADTPEDAEVDAVEVAEGLPARCFETETLYYGEVD